MTPLMQFMIEAKSAGLHCADPAYRRAGAISARGFEENCRLLDPKPALPHLVGSLVDLLKSLPALDDPDAIVKTGSAICYVVDAVRAETQSVSKPPAAPADAPAGWWIDKDRDE